MKTMNWMMTLALVTAFGCGDPIGKDNNDPEPEPDPHNYQEITFLVTNTGTSSVFIDQRTQVLTIYHGNDIYSMGGVCNQPGTATVSSALEVAGAPNPDASNNTTDAAFIEPSLQLRPGDEWSRFWNGIVAGPGSCPNLNHLLGEELVVEFCYGMNIEGSDEWSALPTDLECVRQAFTHTDEPTTVAIDLEPEVVMGDTMPIIVENKSAEAIFVQLSANCGGDTFYSVTHGDEVIEPADPCGPCDCSEGAECMIACDAACVAPSVATIDPGATLERDFSLTYRKQYDEGTHQCSQLQYVPVGPLTATVCYGLGAAIEDDTGFGMIEGEVCETLTFTTTDEEVRLIVQ